MLPSESEENDLKARLNESAKLLLQAASLMSSGNYEASILQQIIKHSIEEDYPLRKDVIDKLFLDKNIATDAYIQEILAGNQIQRRIKRLYHFNRSHLVPKLSSLRASKCIDEAIAAYETGLVWGERRHSKTSSSEDSKHLRDYYKLREKANKQDAINRNTKKSLAAISQRVDAIETRNDELSKSVHACFALQSLGVDTASVPLTRFIPVRIYLSEGNEQTVSDVAGAVGQLMNAFNFSICDEFAAEEGSWYKKYFARTIDTIKQPEVADRLAKLERAVELKALNNPQADVDKKHAEVVSTLLKALEGVPNAAIQCGSVLIVKTNSTKQGACVQVRTLSQRELIFLENNQNLLKNPQSVLQKLSKVCCGSEPEKLPRTQIMQLPAN